MGAISLLLCILLVAVERFMVVHEELLTSKFLSDNTGWPERIIPAVQLVLAFLMGGMPLFLIDGGVSVMLRRRRAKGSYLIYGWISLAFVALLTAIMVSQIVWIAPAYVQKEPGLIRKLTIATISGGLFLIYPAFLMLWFRRRRIRDEVRNWR